MDSLKTIAIFSMTMMLIVLIAMIVSWFTIREIPYEFMSYSKRFFSILIAICGVGSCAEKCVNKHLDIKAKKELVRSKLEGLM